jgi:hypothetical protein
MFSAWIVVLGVCCSVPAAVSAPMDLAKKAEVFQHDMEARFLLEGQALCKLQLPHGGRDFISYNMPDNAYMTGIYVGTLSMKYAVTGDPADLAAAKQSLNALHLLCNVSGKPGLLARAAWPVDRPMADDGIWRASDDGKHQWRGDVSSDQVDGVLYGFSLAYDLIADDDDKAMIAADVAAMVGHILDNDLRIIGYDGKVTTWGKYFPVYTRFEPLNALLLLQAIKIAHHVTGDARFGDAYRKWAIDEGYAERAVRARKSLSPLYRGAVNHSDDVLLFLGYEPLLRYEEDPALRDLYLQSYRLSWEGPGRFPGMKGEANPLYAFLAAKHLGDDSEVAAAIDTLRWLPFDIKWNRDTIARYEEKFAFQFDPTIQSPEPGQGQAIPIDRREKTWSTWVQDPYNSPGARDHDERIEYNGHDYLIGYWLGRYYEMIPAD